MRWEDERRSQNVEDRRGLKGSGGLRLKGPGGIIALIVVMIAGYYGIDLTPLLGTGNIVGTEYNQVDSEHKFSPEEEKLAEFTAVTLATTEELWQIEFSKYNQQYKEPILVLYSDITNTACGFGEAAMGPFYCPSDRKVYIDLSFYKDMQRKLGGGGDFAQGYVVAHEVGHHVQNLLGISTKVRKEQQRSNQIEMNQLSVKMELQADCFAGIWGKYIQTRGLMEIGDLDEAFNTAEAIGDDRLQKESRGIVVPDSFTHGSSEERKAWFKRGFEKGTIEGCNTF